MKTQCLCTMIGIAMLAYLPLIAAEGAFQMEAIPLASQFAADTSLPGVQMVSVTIAAASTVTADPCIGGTRGCPDPTFGYASIPFPTAVLPAGGDAVVSWMFQDISYNGPIQMTVAFVQNGVTVGEPSTSHSSPSVVAGGAYLVHFATSVPAQAALGPAMAVVNLEYGGTTITRAIQEFTVSAATPSGSPALGDPVPSMQVVSVSVAAFSSVTTLPCVGGENECPDPTNGYASIPFPSAVVAASDGAMVTWMFQDVSYDGPIEVTMAFVQNGVVLGLPFHQSLQDAAGVATLEHYGAAVPSEALPGPAMVVVSLSYGGSIARASQEFTLE